MNQSSFRNTRPARGFRRRERGDREEGQRLSSREQLERQALDAAKEVKRWGDPIILVKQLRKSTKIQNAITICLLNKL